jgi:hypothetical protein
MNAPEDRLGVRFGSIRDVRGSVSSYPKADESRRFYEYGDLASAGIW